MFPKRVFPVTALHAISVFHVLAPRTEMWHADEISNLRVPGILGSIKTLEYVTYI